ncbi:MAG TPA: hypothetical protein VMF88_11445 [Bacteroidota bacterium]|nr:hypothetical protein [Bacteroidota bacterium]
MKKYSALVIAVLFVLTAGFSSANASAKKSTKHKHQEKSCCCDMKCNKSDKKDSSNKTDTKKESEQK